MGRSRKWEVVLFTEFTADSTEEAMQQFTNRLIDTLNGDDDLRVVIRHEGRITGAESIREHYRQAADRRRKRVKAAAAWFTDTD